MKHDFDWRSFTLKVDVAVNKEQVFNAWVSQKAMESWFLRSALYFTKGGRQKQPGEMIAPGDTYEWKWFGYPDSVSEKNIILSVDGTSQLSFLFSGSCIVTVTCKQKTGMTICELVQEMPMKNEKDRQHYYIECGKGWTFYLANLKSILEGGIDLRNKNEALKQMINA